VAAIGVLACAMTTAIALSDLSTGDYAVRGTVLGNNAGPALEALAHGRLFDFIDTQPTMGLSSLLLRAPIVAVARAFGAGDLVAYRLGAVLCLLPLGLLATWLVMQYRQGPLGRFTCVAGGLVLLLNAATVDAVSAGHPEDVLAIVLATGAVLAARRGRSGWAALMLGSAVGSMPWAVIAALPVLVATSPQQRLHTAARAGALAAVLTLSLPLADPPAFMRALDSEGHTHLVNVFGIWWPVSHAVHLPGGVLAAVRRLPLGLSRSTATLFTVLAAGLALALAWLRGRHRVRVFDALALLALLGLVRGFADTTQLEYYKIAVLVPLAVWETEGLGRPPLLAALAAISVMLMPTAAAHVDPTALNAVSVGLRLMLFAYLARRALGLRSSVSQRSWPALSRTHA
jgi:hypothetical protein